MKVISIEKFTNKINFTNSEDSKIYPSSDLGCPNCGEIVSINFNNLEKHALSDLSNLNADDRKEMEIFAEQTLQPRPNSFLDYYCPKCNKPIRIYYESWAGGRVETGFELKHFFPVDHST